MKENLTKTLHYKGPIIFFDGLCGLCNHSVDIIIKMDRAHLFLFAPLQGKTAEKLLTKNYTHDLDTIVIFYDGKIYTKSDGIILVFQKLGGFFSILVLLKFFPKFLRDSCYSIVAKYRYQIFGKKESCRLPSPEEKALFLD